MSTDKRSSGIENQVTQGIYLGKVVNHLDATSMGGLEVEILKRTESGNVQEKIACIYASPFYGQTPYSGLGRSAEYASTQKSYGFWAVPPDVGTQVIVLMPEGDYAQAYWVACVPDVGMNFMTPGNAGTTFNKGDPSRALPVGEYNKLMDSPAPGLDPTKIQKPVNTLAQARLEKAGLDKDWIRGTNTSSARREAPSMVFGISTPGPHDRAGPKHRYGPQESQINVAYNRLGGSSFVMDDGDMSMHRRMTAKEGPPDYANTEQGDLSGDATLPANELIRIQTRTGHQIVMHNTEDLIYISHGSGNSWIEMTANGKIDIYSKDSISIRSENDLNFTADRDINFLAKENINMIAEKSHKVKATELGTYEAKNYKMLVTENADIRIEKDFLHYSNNSSIIVNTDSKIWVQQNLDIKTSGNVAIEQKNLQVLSDNETNITGMQTLNLKGTNELRLGSNQGIGLKANQINFSTRNYNLTTESFVLAASGSAITSKEINLGATPGLPFVNAANQASSAAEADEAAKFDGEDYAFYVKRMPAHEPWVGHEHLKPADLTPELTLADTNEPPEEAEAPPFPPITDTFKKSS
tara:strand:+ start:551 stop:2296 length:1746 start_codon:yes stop_codon:yes gene_type:complete